MTFIDSPLVQYIYKKGYSIRGFCIEAKLDRNTLYKWFRGETKRLNGLTVSKIANTLSLTIAETLELCER